MVGWAPFKMNQHGMDSSIETSLVDSVPRRCQEVRNLSKATGECSAFVDSLFGPYEKFELFIPWRLVTEQYRKGIQSWDRRADSDYRCIRKMQRYCCGVFCLAYSAAEPEIALACTHTLQVPQVLGRDNETQGYRTEALLAGPVPFEDSYACTCNSSTPG